ncbi:MAG: AAA family ATPase [Promethearchaeota archaeon]|jgi:type II secretory pathway predicted ATPase ExeA
MYLQHFGLTHDPLGKNIRKTVADQQYHLLANKLNWLLQTKGIGLVTGDTGTGKTTALRKWTKALNPMLYKVMYQADNHFRAFDIYCQLADNLGLEKYHRYSKLWRVLKQELLSLYDDKQLTPIWILDEAHLLPINFLSQLPSFLNFNFDTKDVMIIVLVGLPPLSAVLKRSVYSALKSRILFDLHWQPLDDFASFRKFVISAFQQAGKEEVIISDSGLKLIHLAGKGRLRDTHKIITQSLQLATEAKLNHLSDDLIESVIANLKLN